MRNCGPPKDKVPKRAASSSLRLPSLGGLTVCVGASLVAFLLAAVLLAAVFGNAIINRYGRERAERAFAAAYPGCALRLGELAYAVGANCLVAQSIVLSSSNTTLKVAGVSLTGVSWIRVLRGNVSLADALANASLEATNIDISFPQAQYGLRCARLCASVPGSELVAERAELRPLVSDDVFFAAHAFRTTRFHVLAPECRVQGLAYGDLLQAKSYHATAVRITQPSFDALVNRDKPLKPFVRSPLMVHEALAGIRQPLQVDSLSLTNGHLTYGERVRAGADPGVLTFAAVSLSAEGVANQGEATAVIQLRGQGDLMSAGTLKVLMLIPIAPSEFSLRYSGSLSAMDLTPLNAFVDNAEHTRIKSGRAQEVGFEIDVTAGHARGRVQAIYENLVITVLDRQTGTEKGFDNRVASFLANLLTVRNANASGASGAAKVGRVDYTRKPEDEFLEFVWVALWTGVRDVISH